MTTDPDVTILLGRWSDGDSNALDQLLPQVYADLRRIARMELGRHSKHATLQPTALVNELFTRLLGHDGAFRLADRRHFYNLSAQMMRQLLMARVRAAGTDKRGGSWRRIDIEAMPELAIEEDTRMAELDEALTRLAALNPRMAEVVQLRSFGGFEVEEVAELLGVDARTVYRDWATARAWLRKDLQQ
ncbi:MAG: sigma-70 family RNA polymerase sigma factor [Xanthomonadales bacterium]|nr:sigma-70 family RNA polymerase sigma factor [Xanthomonadales bacterium]